MPTRRRLLHTCLALILSLPLLSIAPAQAVLPEDAKPIVFVHGTSGSAQQFESHAMRFTSNRFPLELLHAYEYDTSQPLYDDQGLTPAGIVVLDELDAFVDAVLAQHGADQVFLAGHSLGTFVSTTYLGSYPGGAAKVAKYVNIDGRALERYPGGVPSIAIWGEWNSAGPYNRNGGVVPQFGPNAEDNFYFPDKSHTEVATAAETFALMYEFWLGRAPWTTDIVPQPPQQVSVAGRAVIFPVNVGFDGAMLDVWRLDARTGQRIGRAPVASYAIDASGDFGPLEVDGRAHYEFALTRPGGTVHHFYQEPFHRTDHFFRLLSAPAGTGLELYTDQTPASGLLTVSRQREFWGDQGEQSDALVVSDAQILTPEISPRSSVSLGIFAFDDGADEMTDLSKGELFPFNLIAFISAADVFVPAMTPATGTVELRLDDRARESDTVLRLPNWDSVDHRSTILFRDDAQEARSFRDYFAAGPVARRR